MNTYETMFILRPNLEEEKRNEVIEKFKNIISQDGEVKEVSEWGVRKLAYEIEKLREGYYVLVDFVADPSLPMELERNFRITDEVIRFMVIAKNA